MRVLLLSLGLAFAAPVVAQAPVDSLPPLPALSVPTYGNFQPLQTSTARALAYSVGTTAALGSLAYVFYIVVPAEDGVNSGYSAQEILAGGSAVLALFGTGVGNFTLGAVDDLQRGVEIRAYGMMTGAGMLALAGLTCLATGDSGGCGALGQAIAIGGFAVFGGGILGGMGYDLATIPGNAREARLRRQRPLAGGVTVAPPEVVLGYSLEARTPVLTFRMEL